MKQIYRAKNSLNFFSVAFVAAALFFAIGAWRGVLARSNTWVNFAIGSVLVLAGIIFAIQTMTCRVVLSDHSISCGSFFRNQSMDVDRIRYRREYEEHQDGPEGSTTVDYLEFVSTDSGTPSLKIAKNDFNLDAAFWDRVMRIPDFESLGKNSLSPAK